MKSFQSLFQIDTEFAFESARVMVIDDEPLVTRTVASVLLHSGFEQVRCVNDSTKAIKEIAKFQPDLLLLDLFMPEVTGHQVLETLRSETRFSDIAILILSAADKASKYKSLRLGATGFVDKPVKPEDLVNAIQHVLRVI